MKNNANQQKTRTEMRNYHLNLTKLQVLPSLLGTTHSEIAKNIGVKKSVWSTHINNGSVRVRELLDVCNLYKLNLSYFISTDENEPIKRDIQCRVDLWTDIKYSAYKLLKRIESGELSYSTITKSTGMSRNTITTLETTDIKVNRVLLICNTLLMDLSDFFSDPTLDRITSKNRINKENMRILEEENRMLRMQVQEMKTRIEKLEKALSKKKPYGTIEEDFAFKIAEDYDMKKRDSLKN